MKLKELVNGQQALIELLKQPLPIGIAWDLKVFVKKAQPELESYEALRMDLIKKYGKPVTEGSDQLQVSAENLKVFFEELNVIQEKEFEIIIPTIKMSELKDKPISISANDMLVLDWLFVE